MKVIVEGLLYEGTIMRSLDYKREILTWNFELVNPVIDGDLLSVMRDSHGKKVRIIIENDEKN